MHIPRKLAEFFWRRPFQPEAFTLLELLAVMAVFGVMVALVPLALSGKKRADDLTKSAYDIAGTLQIARAYATVNNTYVWVGFFEEDFSRGDGTPGTGRVVISTVASKDGSMIYDRDAAMAAAPSSQPLPGASLIQVGKLQKIDNIHLIASPPAFGDRPGGLSAFLTSDRIGSGANYVPLFYFQYPLREPVAKYTFAGQPGGKGIVQFNPRGEAITDSGPVPGVAPCKEIAIQATHGTTPETGPNMVAIDISGMTGVVTIYRK